MRILLSGSSGFAGSFLLDFILQNHPEYDIIATKRTTSNLDNVKHLLNNNKIKFVDCNIENEKEVESVFLNNGPFEKIFHLAAQSSVKTSYDSPIETLTSNINGTLNMLENTKKHSSSSVILIASSSEVYGNQEILPITEKMIPKSISPYSVSKVCSENLAYEYFETYGIKTVITRAFNHIGQRHSDNFVISSFAKQIVEIEKGMREPVIYHGNIEVFRDFTDVRDVVRAYWLALEDCNFAEAYNICSNKSVKIADVLDTLLSFSNIKITRKIDENRLRPSDLLEMRGDNEKFCDTTNWKPEIPLEKTLEDLLNYWREKLCQI